MSHKRKLEKVLEITKVRDEDNESYIPYCSFHHHIGIPINPYQCIQRRCKHYQRFYRYKYDNNSLEQ
jgi:hypothetical protein